MHHSLLLLAMLALAGGDSTHEADFEAKPTRSEPVPGWTLELGARNGATKPESVVEIDRKERHGGKASLRLSGDSNTRGWLIAKQEIPVRPGGKYELEAWTKTEGVKPNGFGIDNCYVGLVFFDAAGEVVGRQFQHPTRPDSGWSKQRVKLEAADSARRGEIYLFLSMIGDFWVDDLTLAIEGGEQLPELELVFSEDFADQKRLSSKWKREVGATNGDARRDSVWEIDPEVGAPNSPRSLYLAGDAETTRWQLHSRTFDAEPGDLWRMRGLVKAQDVRAEGPQFTNLYLSLAFLDRRGDPIGNARFATCEPGTFDWKELVAEGVAPLATRKLRAALFLSMSGEAWFDDLELHKQEGGTPPYGDWKTVEGDEIVLRHSPTHPEASGMKSYHRRLEQAKAQICRSLEVEFDEPITVFLYRDNDEGRLLTGGSLDFADPQNRRVHQRWNSFIAHEMVHVIAHTKLRYSGTGILGEGIAVWLNGQSEDAHHRRAMELLSKDELPSVDDLLQRFRQQEAGYPAAGSFCGFLIDTHGLEAFKEIYPLDDPSAKLAELVGESFTDMQPAWHEHLRKFR